MSEHNQTLAVCDQDVEPSSMIAGTPLVFDPQLRLTDKQKKQICDWPILQEQIAERAKKFQLKRIVVKGPCFAERDNTKLVSVEARVFYMSLGQEVSCLGIFMPDRAAFLKVFRVAAKECVKHYVELVVQKHPVANNPWILEVPNGFRTIHETPRAAVCREHIGKIGVSWIAPRTIKQLGKSLVTDVMSGRQHLFWAVIDATPEQMKCMTGYSRRVGPNEEGEATTIVVLPLARAIRRVENVEGGHALTQIALRRAEAELRL